MDATARIDRLFINLVSESSIPSKLKAKEFIETKQYDEVIEDTEFLIEFFKDKECVPKKLALCFEDIFSAFCLKKEDITEETKDADLFGIRLQELAYELFDVEY